MANSIVQLRIDDLKAEATAIYEKKEYNSAFALQAMKELNEEAKKSGVSDMSLDEINAEIAAYRKTHHSKQ